MTPNPKPETYKNEAYEAHVRSKPCLLCSKESIMHHEQGLGIGLVGGGIAKKCSSLAGLPLCIACHNRRHDQGYITFWHEVAGWQGKYGAQARIVADGIAMREIIKLQMEFIENERS